MEYLKNPLLNTVNPFYHGNKFDKGRFFNDYERIHPSRMDFIKHGLSRNPQRKEKKNSSWKIDLVESRVFIETKEDVLMWLGHSSFFLRMDGISILIDPVFFNLPFYKRKVKIPYKIEDFKNIDYILVSHNHRDHMDLGTLKILVKNNPQAIILTGLKNGLTLRKIKNAKIQEAGWYQKFITDKRIEIIYTPAIHWSRRYLWDMNRALWGGFFIVSSNTSLYFAGDTKMGKHFHDIKNIFGNPDFSLFPIVT
ncbi:MAG TPA: Zn-dependent hydrolase [Saprospiraceae bacterium]|nr:Zn-dependent hydrolase [Saprospiraceae bacterium]